MAKTKTQAQKMLIGTVVSTKMQKTAVVVVERYKKHPRYGKFVRSRKRYKVHDLDGLCREGDRVVIVACRPISKDKHFMLLRSEEKKYNAQGGIGEMSENAAVPEATSHQLPATI